MFGGIKITLIICLTIITSCVLFISYTEYSDRYSLVSTSDNGIYIFDKKSTVLNKCDGKECVVIETKLPTKTILNQDSALQQRSALFEAEKSMVASTLATKEDSLTDKKSTQVNENKSQNTETKSEKQKTTEKTKPATSVISNSAKTSLPAAKNKSNKKDDEFVE